MRINKTKQLRAYTRVKNAKAIPLWVIKKTDKHIRRKIVKYSWRKNKLKI
jgi:ribosomal protein L39E